MNFTTRSKGKPKPVLIRALLDSGASGTLIAEKFAAKLAKTSGLPKQHWKTVTGIFMTSEQVEAKFLFPELFENQIVEWKTHVSPNLGNYDMILGRDILSDLKMDPRFSTQCVEWEGASIPFKDTDTDPLSYYIQEHYTISEETEWIKRILDAKYEAADLKEIANSCDHLSPQKEKNSTICWISTRNYSMVL